MGGLPRHGLAVVVFLLVILALLLSGCGGHTAPSALQRRLLTVADLPAGWSSTPTSTKVGVTHTPCLSSLPEHSKGLTYAAAAFVQGTSVPTLAEVLATGSRVQQVWKSLNGAMARCRTATIDLGGTKVKSTVHLITFPRIGGTSSAYAWAFTLAGIKVAFDLITFQARTYAGYISYADLGGPQAATVKAFASAAVTKAAKGSTARVADTVSIASAPVHTAHTTLGDVAYRTVGSGPPLVLITGYSGTMEGWDRRFVQALAQRYRIVIFDNAGVGETHAVTAPLTIDAMANQTSALIDTLGLQRPNILGWSMGSMIAQALAVLHPTQVRRLILCASYPGDSTAVRPSREALNAFESGDPPKVMASLFPADQTAAQNTYLAAISSYPTAAPAPAAVVTAQGHAVDDWWAGRDLAGGQTGTIAEPTLVADGTLDRLDPVANSHTLANLIPGAKLTLYPDAGHAFLFQDQPAFTTVIESFLG
jgi:pimeloyl-ACP methyl ester carboxylesterase